MTAAVLNNALDRLERLSTAMRLRANRAARAAGLGPERNMWRNAMIARRDGRPWARIDYSALRLALRIEAKREGLYQLRSRLYAAARREVLS